MVRAMSGRLRHAMVESLAMVAALAACLEVRGSGYRCSSTGACPSGLVCVAGRCERDAATSSVADGGVDVIGVDPVAVDAEASGDDAVADGANDFADARAVDARSSLDAPPLAACDNDDLQCPGGICAIDRCSTDVFEIPYALELPVIDGVTDAAWGGGSVVQRIGHRIFGTRDDDAPDGQVAEFQLMWNEEALFLRARVTDAERTKDGALPVPTFDDDGVELFIDAAGTRLSTVDAFANPSYNQVMFGYGSSLPGNFTQHRIAGIEFRIADTRIGDGYIVEAVMPWKALGAAPERGRLIGLDVHVNDDDDGGARDRKWTWFGLQDLAWSDPRACGRARLLAPP